MRALLISTYDLGRQPFGLASPAAWLRREGLRRRLRRRWRRRRSPTRPAWRAPISSAFHLPMHTATRLAAPVIQQGARAQSRGAHLRVRPVRAAQRPSGCGRSAWTTCSAASSKDELTAIARELATVDGRPPRPARRRSQPALRLTRSRGCSSSCPIASGLPPLARYATLQHAATARAQVVGYTEASRGCRHLCRHCPVVPVYNGQFRVVQPDVVLADIAAQVAAGARAHHVRRSRFLQRPDARAAHRRGAARGASRASPTTSRSRSSICCSIAICCRGCATPAACS